jgi:hypothetical protein
MEYTFENINKWVEELAEKPKMTQFHTYARVLRDKERQEAEKIILDKFDKNNAHHGAKSVTIVNDDMAIVTFNSTKGDTHYIPVVQNKPAIWWFETFEQAIIGAISLLKTDGIEAAKYAGKILDVKI